MGGQFTLNADLQGVARGGGSCVQGLLLERGDDGDVQCRGVTTAPGGEEYVCRPGLGVGHHTGSLSHCCQGRRPGSEEQDVADGVVVSNPVPVASTPHLVVSKGIRCAAELWATITGAVEWHSQPVPQAAAELLILEVEPQGSGWHTIQPVSSMRQC